MGRYLGPTHQFFLDEVLIFKKVFIGEVRKLTGILDFYNYAAGMEVNISKSVISFSSSKG